MQQPHTNMKRVAKALAREGLDVDFQSNGAGAGVWTVRRSGDGDAPDARVLLPAGFPLEAKALRQLADLAGVTHPDGGRVRRAFASPDLHPGDSGIAIGSVVETEGMVIPAAVGGDINCGMRLHVADISVDRFLADRDRFVRAMTGDYLMGTRDLPMSAAAMRGLFRHGIPGWLDAISAGPTGQLRASDLDQLFDEADRVHLGGSMDGDPAWAPEALAPDDGAVRDGGQATIGGGNHFVEVQRVEAVLDRRAAWRLGVREGQLAFMIHSGSRLVGKQIGRRWIERARAAWPADVPFPEARIFPLSVARDPELVRDYLTAQATAANYGFVNRLLLAELLRLRLREVYGDVAAPLVYDLPHNITLPTDDGWISRKGACPAGDHPVIIPGSMGAASFLLWGRAADCTLCSASHGAGRARSRFEMGRRGARRDEAALGLGGVDCVTLRAERRIEEAPAAYKPIQPVVDVQVDAGSVTPVARLQPILTFKA